MFRIIPTLPPANSTSAPCGEALLESIRCALCLCCKSAIHWTALTPLGSLRVYLVRSWLTMSAPSCQARISVNHEKPDCWNPAEPQTLFGPSPLVSFTAVSVKSSHVQSALGYLSPAWSNSVLL